MCVNFLASCLILLAGVHICNAEPQSTNGAVHVISLSLPVWKTEKELRRWAVSDPEILESEIVKVEKNTNAIVVIPKVTGSGIWRVTLYIYGYGRDTNLWHPLGVYFTNTSRINVETVKRGSELLIKSKGGRTLLTIPIAPYLLNSMPVVGEY
jgi:hypothetical protein